MEENNTIKRPKPIVLVILDGWGVAPAGRSNAISQAKTPFFNHLIGNYPAMTLAASAEAVGLPWGEMGNSEVGHSTLGTGMIIYQNFPRITKSIWDKDFFKKPALVNACKHANKNKSSLHLLGLISTGGVHSYIDHLYALLELAKQQKVDKVYIHCILDGRDMAYDSALDLITRLEERIKSLRTGKIATIIGRYYAMDRDNRWDRTEQAYKMLTQGEAENYYSDPVDAIEETYAKKIYDEEFKSTVIGTKDKPAAVIKDNDSVIFFNFRPDRARQLSKAFILPGFDSFSRPQPLQGLNFVTMVEYDNDLPGEVVFPGQEYDVCLAKVFSEAGKKQLHVAETEKYAHVTYFFNGGREKTFPGEDHLLIPSPQVATYDIEPEMSAQKIAEQVSGVVQKDVYDLIVINFANADMVGHTGDIRATIKAIEAVDKALEVIIPAVLERGGAAFITADHGNAEELFNLQTGERLKEHSTNPVPFIAINKQWEGLTTESIEVFGKDLSLLEPQGVLADVAPTIIKAAGLQKPDQMIGRALI